LIPAERRGGYLVREQGCVALAGAISFSLAAVALGRDARPWQFALVFGFSAITGVISLSCLKRIPDRPPPPEDVTVKGPVPWREIAAFPPFRKILRASVAWSIAYGGMTTFVVSFLRAHSHLSEATILFGMAVYFVGGLASLWVAASRLDRLGSKPALEGVMVLCGVVTIGWFLQAGGVVHSPLALVATLLFLLGLGNSLFSAANFRLAMLTVPRMGRSHFFALFSVVWNLTLGVSPVAWGLLIDFVGESRATLLGVEFNRFSVFFGLVVVAFGVAYAFMRRLEEPSAARMHVLFRELIFEEPKKALARFWPAE
jgi:MFS family permease